MTSRVEKEVHFSKEDCNMQRCLDDNDTRKVRKIKIEEMTFVSRSMYCLPER